MPEEKVFQNGPQDATYTLAGSGILASSPGNQKCEEIRVKCFFECLAHDGGVCVDARPVLMPMSPER